MEIPTTTEFAAEVMYNIHEAIIDPGVQSRYIVLNLETKLIEIISDDEAMFGEPYDNEDKYLWVATVYPNTFQKIQIKR